jgi:predicted lipoprotein with Yx(FWY)xxD motif
MRSTTTMRARAQQRRATLPALAVGILALSACSSGGDTSSAAQDTGSSGARTVMVKDTDAGEVLANSSGRTLYFSEQEKNKVLCTSGACGAIWTPLTLSGGDRPRVAGELAKHMTTIKRPDGTSQVAYGGRPLYTFSFDHGAGEVNGEGIKDTFDGTEFVWRAATPTGAAPSGSPTTSPSSSYDNGRY